MDMVMDLSDAALRERADAISRKCGTWDAVPSEAAMRFVADECYAAFLALRDAALRQGELQEAAKHADCCVAREELDATLAEMNIVKNRALEALTKQLIADLAIPCQRHGCMWDAPEAHEACRDAARAEQREADARKADECAGETARWIASAIRSTR